MAGSSLAKNRCGFVTNSSSSSFIISKKYITDDQVKAIVRHSELGKALNLKYPECAWDIVDEENYVYGYTDMDNFNMYDFLDRIDIDKSVIKWNVGEEYTEEYYEKGFTPEWLIKLRELDDRGQRAKIYPVDDFMGFKLKWYQKILLSFYDIKLKLLQKYDEWWWKKYIKH